MNESHYFKQKVVNQKSRNKKLENDNDAVETERNSNCQDEGVPR